MTNNDVSRLVELSLVLKVAARNYEEMQRAMNRTWEYDMFLSASKIVEQETWVDVVGQLAPLSIADQQKFNEINGQINERVETGGETERPSRTGPTSVG